MLTAMLPTLGIDMVQLGAIVVTNLAIGMLTPPIGICLIVSASISGDSITAVSRQIWPFLAVLPRRSSPDHVLLPLDDVAGKADRPP